MFMWAHFPMSLESVLRHDSQNYSATVTTLLNSTTCYGCIATSSLIL